MRTCSESAGKFLAMTGEKIVAAFMSSMAEPRKKCEVKPVYKTWTRHSLLGISGLPSRTNLLHFAVSRKLFQLYPSSAAACCARRMS